MTNRQRASLAALATLVVYTVGACGSTLTQEQRDDATRQSIALTVEALPPAIKGPTQTAIMATIVKGITQP